MIRGMSGWRPSITTVLLVGFGGMVAAPVLLTNVLTLFALKQTTDELLNDFAITSLTSVSIQVDRSMTIARSQTEFLAEQIRDGSVDATDADQMVDLMRGALSGTRHVLGIAYFGPAGDAIRVGRIGEGIGTILGDWREEPTIIEFVDQLKQGAFRRSRTAVYVPSLDEPAVSVETTVALEGEAFQGVFAAVVGTAELSKFVAELSEHYEGTAFVLQGREEVIAHPELAVSSPALSLEKPLPRTADMKDPIMPFIHYGGRYREDLGDLFPDGQASGQYIEVDGLGPDGGQLRKVVIMQPLTGFDPVPWTVGIHYDADAVDTQVNRLAAAAILISIAVVAVSIIGLLLGRGIARPIRSFAKTAEAVEVLDFSDVPPAKRSLLKEIDETALRFDAMVTALKRLETYVPKPLVKRLMQMEKERIEPETRQVTILFTDIQGFTAFSEGAGAAKVARFLNRHFTLVTDAIGAHGGTVDKFIGDSVMAFWGALEDDPDQTRHAVMAALDIREAIQDHTPEVRMRIGIHSGAVVAGAIGSDGRVNYTIVGDAVNVAQRLEGLGRDHPHESGVSILLSSEVAANMPPWVTAVASGKAALKGRDAPIEVFMI